MQLLLQIIRRACARRTTPCRQVHATCASRRIAMSDRSPPARERALQLCATVLHVDRLNVDLMESS
jgi:hypothetical protein